MKYNKNNILEIRNNIITYNGKKCDYYDLIMDISLIPLDNRYIYHDYDDGLKNLTIDKLMYGFCIEKFYY